MLDDWGHSRVLPEITAQQRTIQIGAILASVVED